MDKRSATYSSRPDLVVAGRWVFKYFIFACLLVNLTRFSYGSTSKRLLLLPYGEQWRQQRTAFHRDMTPNKIITYLPIQIAETKLLMGRFLQTPERFMTHLRQYSANVILKSKREPFLKMTMWLPTNATVAYGLDSERGNQKVVSIFAH